MEIKENNDNGIIFWHHRGFWQQARSKFHADGIHIHPRNDLHLYARSVRGAILQSVSIIIKYSMKLVCTLRTDLPCFQNNKKYKILEHGRTEKVIILKSK